jgi:hypothetical protein
VIRTKSLAALLLLFLAAPGSGQLAWDGLPMSTRLELATLILFVIFFASHQLRSRLKDALENKRWRGAVGPLLVTLAVIKFGTFALSPLADGFESCYRSLYNPIEDSAVCERSYELPIRPPGPLNGLSISRTDPSIDFGVNQYDWSLPFVNDWRLQSLWLTRPPFKATFRAKLENDSPVARYAPILAIGEISATNGQDIVERKEYSHQFLSILPVPQGASNFELTYQYRDDELSIPPGSAPEPRGPYALLKVGAPTTIDEIYGFASVYVDTSQILRRDPKTPFSVFVRDDNGKPLFDELYEDAKQIRIPLALLESSKATISANLNGTPQILGHVYLSAKEQTGPQISFEASGPSSQGIRVWLDSERTAFDAAKPGTRAPLGIPLWILLLLVDFCSALIVVCLVSFLISVVKRSLLTMAILAIAGWVAVNPLYNALPRIMGGEQELIVPYALIAVLVIMTQRRLNQTSFATFAPLAVVLAYQKVFDHLRFNHDGQGENWWGKLLFFWRDSDWFATNGFARIIFETGSLQGGESVFWFQAGPRYWALFLRILFGENDVLIGLVMTSLGFLSIMFLATRIAVSRPTKIQVSVMFAVLIGGFLFQGDQLMTAFAFVGSSEHPSWIVTFALTGYLLRRQGETRSWLLVTISAVLAILIHMRPNQIFLLLALFGLVLTLVDGRDVATRIRVRGWMLATFVCISGLSLLHNVFYGGSVVPFTGNASINYAFEWTDLMSEKGAWGALATVWTQLRTFLYWQGSPDPNLAIFFWGAQAIWMSVMVAKLRGRTLFRKESVYLLLPFTYLLPMLKYQATSYYPRHLVIGNVALLAGALLAWANKPSTAQKDDTAHQIALRL